MYTIIETATFTQAAKAIWSEQDRAEFCVYIANHPLAGDVVPHSGVAEKCVMAWLERVNEVVRG